MMLSSATASATPSSSSSLSPSSSALTSSQSPVIIGKSLNPTRTVGNSGSLWTKVKSKVSDSQGSNSKFKETAGDLDNDLVTKLAKNGQLITYVLGKRLQIWDWSEVNTLNGTSNVHSQSDGNLHLVADLSLKNEVLLIEPLICNRKSGVNNYLMASRCSDTSTETYIKWEVYTWGPNSATNFTRIKSPKSNSSIGNEVKNTEEVESFAKMNYEVQYSANHFVIGDSFGSVNIYDMQTLERSSLDIQCRVHDGRPIFSLQGSILAYNSADSDVFRQQIKANSRKHFTNDGGKLKDTNGNGFKNDDTIMRNDKAYSKHTSANVNSDGIDISGNEYKSGSNIVHSSGLTPLSLSRPNTLAKKLWKNLSKSAIDGAFLIGGASHSKVMSLFYSDQDRIDEAASLKQREKLLTSKTLKDVITKVLNTLSGNSNYVILLDLKNETPLTSFSPPDGCSNLSLSSYDCLISTTTLRGDDIFIWDYSKFESEIRLLETFRRGRTSAIIQDLLWTRANKSIILLSKLSGSIHCFANEFEELTIPKSKRQGKTHSSNRSTSSNFSDYEATTPSVSWVLSSMGAKSIVLGSKSLYPKINEQFIIAMDKVYLYVITLDGYMISKFVLPSSLVKEVRAQITYPRNSVATSPTLAALKPTTVGTSSTPSVKVVPSSPSPVAKPESRSLYDSSINPLSQVIIEPCAPFVPWYNDRRVEIAMYNEADGDNEELIGSFEKRLDNFEPELPFTKIQFGRDPAEVLFHKHNVGDLRKAIDSATIE